MIDMLDVLGSCQACWLGGYLALYDREDGSPWHIITSEDAIKAASESDHSDGAGMDAVTEHQFSVAIAPPNEFTNVRTISGDKLEGRQPWRSIVGLAGQAERRPPGYCYDKLVCFLEYACPLPRARNQPIAYRCCVHPIRCEVEGLWAYVDRSMT